MQERLIAHVPHSGWGNQLLALEHVAWLAAALNRTLVLPPLLEQGDLKHGVCHGRKPPTRADELVRALRPLRGSRPGVEAVLSLRRTPSLPASATPALPACDARSARNDTTGCFLVSARCMSAAAVRARLLPALRGSPARLLQLGDALTVQAGGQKELRRVLGAVGGWQHIDYRRTNSSCEVEYHPHLWNLAVASTSCWGRYRAVHLRTKLSSSWRAQLDAARTRGAAAGARLFIASDDLDLVRRAVPSGHLLTRTSLCGREGAPVDDDAWRRAGVPATFVGVLQDVLFACLADEFEPSNSDLSNTLSFHVATHRRCEGARDARAARKLAMLSTPRQVGLQVHLSGSSDFLRHANHFAHFVLGHVRGAGTLATARLLGIPMWRGWLSLTQRLELLLPSSPTGASDGRRARGARAAAERGASEHQLLMRPSPRGRAGAAGGRAVH